MAFRLKHVLFTIISALFLSYLINSFYNYINRAHPWIQEDSLLNATQLIVKHGYNVDSHEVKTEDGYLLTVFRISSKKKLNKNGIPVLMMHCFGCSSMEYIISGKDSAPAYFLVDNGFDVWLTNTRGSYYSRKHESLSPDDDKFWKFGIHEIGVFDIPVVMDYITAKTGHEKMHYIGHSQGTIVFFIMASEKPEMNKRILSMQALAPVVYMIHGKALFLEYMNPYSGILEKIIDMFGTSELARKTDFRTKLSNTLCYEGSMLYDLCSYIFFLAMGPPSKYFNKTMLPVHMSHVPAGVGFRQYLHFLQMRNVEKFIKYDYGKTKNLEVYGLEKPPEYDLSKVTAPVSIHYSNADIFFDEADVKMLYDKIKNPVGMFKVPAEDFHHMDLIWSVEAKGVFYNKMLEMMLKSQKLTNPSDI